MASRTIVGLCGLAVLLAVTVYLLFQIPWEYAVGGIVVLVGMTRAVGTQ